MITIHATASFPGAECCAAPSFIRGISRFSRREFQDSISSKWFVLYTLAFTVLAVGVSVLSLSGVGSHGFAGFGRTAAGLLNLIMLVVPLMALTAGAGTIAGERERGTLLYLLAQPVSRTQILIGKYVGIAAALVCSLCIGFGISGGILTWRAGGVGVGAYAMLVLFTVLLALAMLSVGFLISVTSRRSTVATGIALFTWLSLVFVSDLGLMASSIIFKLHVQEVFGLAILNPLQAFKMAVIVNLNASLDVLGPVGAYASYTLGESLAWVLASALVAWIVLPLALAAVLFGRRKSI
jgi:Cu-processing system permease protein